MKPYKRILEFSDTLSLKRKNINSVIDKWFCVQKKSKKPQIDVKKTHEKHVKIAQKFGLPLYDFVTVFGSSVINASFNNNQFIFQTSFVPFQPTILQPYPFLLYIRDTEIVITKHAISRFIERNTDCIETALKTFGVVFRDINDGIIDTMYDQDILIKGQHNRTAATRDGGAVFIKIDNPEEHSFAQMKWTFITYISSKMIKEHNIEDIKAEWEHEKNFDFKTIYNKYNKIPIIGNGNVKIVNKRKKNIN